eukprot:CAMPEP_0197661426 /NCGR_PEP_ID=MMETSP1338-20131121/51447_1 /TAXON_ID=43686 ORGANISM="Pelagodinium beii, Strain RCC1491" /NCGR_SAMPLE_ID=MMETSP1338 /ASSEMBLY_ACC=CAM_ASM_000754 /LENGTH=673 /DNA_ID=CAMNT_0043238979 /DNA_START=46 /DNA_END=2067 /DNA_ORIENTATION=-
MGCCASSVSQAEDPKGSRKGKKAGKANEVTEMDKGSMVQQADLVAAIKEPAAKKPRIEEVPAVPGQLQEPQANGIAQSIKPAEAVVGQANHPAPDLRAASDPSTPKVQASPASAVTKEGLEQRSGSPGQPTTISKASLPFQMVPVGAAEDTIRGVFDEYMLRVPAHLQKSLDCSWTVIEKETKKAQDGCGDPMQWYWLVKSEEPAKYSGPKDALGLLVYRMMRNPSANHGFVCHLSFTEDPWYELLPELLESLRFELFKSMPISTIRVTLWYATQEDGKWKLDKDVDSKFKEAGYRWLSLANSKDGRRGQIMMQRRVEERDPAGPEDVSDVCLASCLMLPQKQAVEVVEEAGPIEACSNALVLAECLRRYVHHTVEEPTDAAPEGSFKSSKIVQRLLQRLTHRQDKKPGMPLVRCVDASNAQACEAFATECLKDVDGSSSMSWLCRAAAQADPTSAGEAHRVLCSGLAVAVNWQEHREDPALPGFVRVAVSATGGKGKPEFAQNPVAYLATEDDELFVMVWKLPAEMAETPDEDLYDVAVRLLREAPPSEEEGDRAVKEVVLPRLQKCCPASLELPRAAAEAVSEAPPPAEDTADATTPAVYAGSTLDLGGSRELMGVRLRSRATPSGALLPSIAAVKADAEILRLNGAAIFCVWHAKFDDLEVPLFVCRLRP